MKKIIVCLLVVLMAAALIVGFAAPAQGLVGESESGGAAEYKFAVVGPGVHPFYELFPTALADASADLGIPEVSLQFPQEFNQNEQNTILDGLVSKGYTGIAIQPSDSVAANEKITELINNGVIMVGFGASPVLPTDLPFFVGTDYQNATEMAVTALIEQMGEKGNLVHLTGGLADANTEIRMRVVEETVAKYPDVTLMQTLTDIDVAEAAQSAVNNLMGANREKIDGIICTAYVPSVTVAKVFETLDETRIKVIAIDTDESVLQAVRDGYITGTMAQNPYGMAYIPVRGLKFLADGMQYKADSPYHVDSGAFIITKDNIDNLDAELANTTQNLLSNFDTYFE